MLSLSFPLGLLADLIDVLIKRICCHDNIAVTESCYCNLN